MNRNAATVEEYLAQLPEDRRAALEAVRGVITRNLPKGYAEGMQYGMIGYFVPHSVYPAGYHCDPRQPLPFAGLASQKNHMSLYLCCGYLSPEHEAWFRRAWTATGRTLDMGKACVRFKKLEDVPLEVVGEAIRRVGAKEFIRLYEQSRSGAAKSGATGSAAGAPAAGGAKARKAPAKRAGARAGAQPAKKTASRKTTAKKTASKGTSRRKAVSKKGVSKQGPSRKGASKRGRTGAQAKSTAGAPARKATRKAATGKAGRAAGARRSRR